MKIGRAFFDPLDELGQPGMSTQRIDCVIRPRQFGFCQGGVNFVVANLMQQHGFAAFSAPKPGDQVVKALQGVRRDGPPAKRAKRRDGHASTARCQAGRASIRAR